MGLLSSKLAKLKREEIEIQEEIQRSTEESLENVTYFKDLAQDQLEAQFNRNTDLQEENDDLIFELGKANRELKDKNQKLKDYEELLSKPFEEIAKHNKSFAKTYSIQQELLADWMVSQKAFKQLAIELGLELGKNPNDIVNQGFSKELDVLNNMHDPIYKNNANQSIFIEPYIDILKNKFKR